MPHLKANGVELFYEDHGQPGDPAILLIMGLGTQLIAWPDDFVAQLVDRGFRVIRFDNRDIGLSTHLDGASARHPLWALIALRMGLPFKPAYTLTDMAADAVALLDGLGIARAHVVGASMGGMIAQLVAAHWPDRVLSLTSIMSSSGAPGLPGPTRELRRVLMMRRPVDPTRDEAIAAGAKVLSMISFPDPARAPNAFSVAAAIAYDRDFHPLGTRRQLLAILADGSRVDRLATISAPALVVHGGADPLIPAAAGRDTARHIKGARFELVMEMAHDLPPSQTTRLVALIADHAAAHGGTTI
ncbi:MAG: alpha/beta hydrolase [Sphingomonas sp.]